jgi:hypothetical protein
MNKKLTLVQPTSFDISMFEVDKEKGLVNLTKIAQYFGKDIFDWKRLPNTVRYLEALEAKNSLRDNLVVVNGGDKPGTWASKQIARKFSAWVSLDFELYLDDKIDELFTKGYTSIDGQSRLTQKEYLLVEQLASYYQYTDNIDIECKNAIKTLSNRYNGDYAKANIEFNRLANYDLKEVRTKYEQTCLVHGIKCLKSTNKKDMTFIADPYKLVANAWTAICINNNIDNFELGKEIVEFLVIRDISLTRDCTSVGLLQQLQPNNSLLRLAKNSNIYKQLMSINVR